jgi:hypothetical protein
MKYIKLFDNYIDKHYLEQEVTTNVESVRGHKVESILSDILVELFDKGMQVQVRWPSNNIIVLVFHYPLDSSGLLATYDTIFKIGDIYEYCLMISDYMKEFWGGQTECSYEYDNMQFHSNRVFDLSNLTDKDVRFVNMYINKIPKD